MSVPALINLDRASNHVTALELEPDDGGYAFVDGRHSRIIGLVDQPPRFLPNGQARPPWRAESIDGKVTVAGDSKAEVIAALAHRLGYETVTLAQVTTPLI